MEPRSSLETRFTCDVKAVGLQDLYITTKDKSVQYGPPLSGYSRLSIRGIDMTSGCLTLRTKSEYGAVIWARSSITDTSFMLGNTDWLMQIQTRKR